MGFILDSILRFIPYSSYTIIFQLELFNLTDIYKYK
jgi:hypothetical protein